MAAAEAAATRSEFLWDEDWEELLDFIERKRVVPIIGPASSTLLVDGQAISLEAYVAERLPPLLDFPPGALPSNATLNDVVSGYLRRNGLRERLYRRVRQIVDAAPLGPPPVLRQLAEIRQFNLYVTTAFDPLLEAAINEVRFGGAPRTQAIAYAPNNVRDLETSNHALIAPTVFHLFGKLSASPSYAISDEDVLEFLHELQSESRCPERLFEALANNHLLVVGGNFPDWAARMFLRTAKGRRLSDPREVIEILADDQSGKDPGLIAFLASFSSRTKIFHASAETFVETLSKKCRERFGGRDAQETIGLRPPADEMPDGAIFISYVRADLAAVLTLKEDLEKAGFSVWLDLDRIGAGDTFDPKIQNNIQRCSLFLPVLSRNTEARTEAFFRREWRFALDRDLYINPGTPFIIPVAIDDPREFTTLPGRFREIHITAAPEGRAPPEFMNRLLRIGGRQ
jgi:hypothetical protein